MKIFLCRQKRVALIFLSLALAGCFGGQSPPTNFYMLSPLSPSQAGTSPASAEVVVAEYLKRNEIVINLDNTIYHLAEFSQWAEPLDDNLTRVLEENLTKLLRDDSIDVIMASETSIPFGYRLEVDVLRLDGNLGDQVRMVVQWALLEGEEDDLKLMRRSEYQEEVTDETYKGLVLAKSRTIEKLSRDMADAIKEALALNN